MPQVSITVNGKTRKAQAEPREPPQAVSLNM